jgi:hypothetical protein
MRYISFIFYYRSLSLSSKLLAFLTLPFFNPLLDFFSLTDQILLVRIKSRFVLFDALDHGLDSPLYL